MAKRFALQFVVKLEQTLIFRDTAARQMRNET